MSDNVTLIYGKRACDCQVRTLPMIESRLKAAGIIRDNLAGLISQGAYSHGALSGNTHAGGGVWDVAHTTVDVDAEVGIWRRCGVAMWERTEDDSVKFGPGNRHGHGVWIGCPHLDPSAAQQVRSYAAGRDGLINNRPDRYPRPGYITWQQALSDWEREQDKAKELDMDEKTLRKIIAEECDKAIERASWDVVIERKPGESDASYNKRVPAPLRGSWRNFAWQLVNLINKR